MSQTPSNTTSASPLTLIEGEISVLATLHARNRVVHRVLISADMRRDDLHNLEAQLGAAGATWQRQPREAIDALAQGKTHGGVVAEVGERKFVSLEDLLHRGSSAPPLPRFFAMLDGIEDPFNFGQAVRALYAAGVDGLVVRPRNWMSAAIVVTRASAGTSELMPTAIAENPEAAAGFSTNTIFELPPPRVTAVPSRSTMSI